MLAKKQLLLGLGCLCILFYEPILFAQESIAQTLSISTRFKNIVGNPSWIIELRDLDSGEIFPYLFDIKHKEEFFLAFSKEHSYKVKASMLKFGSYVTIYNFCGLENGVLTGKSMFISVTGTIAPDLRSTRCHVIKFNQGQFTVVPPNPSS